MENKHTGQIYQQNKARLNSKTLYFSTRDYFLKSAKVFGEDVADVRQLFEKNKVSDFQLDEARSSLEFHVSKIKLLNKLNRPVEVGISTQVLEDRNGETVLRELKVDFTTPLAFKLSDV